MIKNLCFPLYFLKFAYGDLTFVGTSAAECTLVLFHLKYVILYEAFIDMCIFKLTFYEAFLTVAMQKYREGCTHFSDLPNLLGLGEVSATSGTIGLFVYGLFGFTSPP